MTVPDGELIGPDRLERLAEEGWSIASGWKLKSGGYYYTIRRLGWERIKLDGPLAPATLAQLAGDGWTLVSGSNRENVFERPVARS